MNDTLTKLRIFVASPSDMATERAKVESVAVMLKPLADTLGIVIDIMDWRVVVPDMGRPEQVILDQLKPTAWDVLVGILWHRFGTPSGKEFQSGTEEEFVAAYRLWKQYGKPRIMMYRCNRPAPLDALDPDQFKLVKEFFAQFDALKGEHPGLYQSFDTSQEFERLLLDNLQRLLLEYGEQIRGKPIEPEVVQSFAPKIPNNLPRRAAFFGRAKELDLVMRALSPADRTWGVLVDGIGGIGKTALAIEVAHRTQDAGAFEAFVFVSAKHSILAPTGIREQTPAARTLEDFLNETARVLGQHGILRLSGDEKRRALLDALRSTRALLIFDNLESLSKEEQEALADFLRELPQGCKAIITSRRRGGEGAVWLRVEKLDWDAARGIIENEMVRDAGLANKLRRVASRWYELYDETNGSPLVLMHTLGLMRVRATLTFDAALAMLRGNHDEDLHKFVFQEESKELTTNDKTALGALSFFVPSATFEAWMQIADLSRNALEATIDRLSALSLVDVLTGEERYALHPLTRAFIRDELLGDGNVAHETGVRFARYWVDYAEQYGGSTRNYVTFSRLEPEWANLEATSNWMWERVKAQDESIADRNTATMMVSFAEALSSFLLFSGRWDECLQINARGYDAACGLGDWSGAGSRSTIGIQICTDRALNNEALVWLKRYSAALEQGVPDLPRAVFAMEKQTSRQSGDLGEVSQQLEKVEELGKVTAKQMLGVARAGARIRRVPKKLVTELYASTAGFYGFLGDIAYQRGDHDSARESYIEALRLARKASDKPMQSQISCHLGQLSFDRRQWRRSQKWFEDALALAQEVGNVNSVADAKQGLARVLEAEGHTNLALPLAQEAMKIYERLQHKDLAQVRELVEKLQRMSR